jgi:predicted O-methyltransferase YrrM
MPYTELDLPRILRDAANRQPSIPSLQPTTQRMLADGSVQVPESGFFDNVHLGEALELYSVVRQIEPMNSFEIGFCSGGSGLAILKALHDLGKGHHFSCDPYQSSYARGAGLRNVETSGLSERWTLHEKFPEDIMSLLPPIQFAFIDASHLFDLSILDFCLVDKRLEIGGVLAFHDLWMPSLQKVIRYILANRGYRIYQLGREDNVQNLHLTWRSTLARVLKHLPRAKKLFAPEILTPWETFGFTNLGFLQKVSNDNRDWRHHEVF